jgi:hypothetical protein
MRKKLRGWAWSIRARVDGLFPADAAAGDKGRPGGPAQVALQPLKTLALPGKAGTIEQVLLDEGLDHPEGEGSVAARFDREVLVGDPTGGVSVGIDDQQTTALLLRLGDILPEMNIADLDIDAPGDNEIGRCCKFRRAARGLAAVPGPGGAGRGKTDGLIKTQGPESIEEGVAGEAVDRPHIAGIGIGQDGLAAVMLHHLGQPCRQDLPGLVPGYPRKPPSPLAPVRTKGWRRRSSACTRLE